MGTGERNAGSNTTLDQHPTQWGVEILLVASCYRNRDKLRPGGPLSSYADFESEGVYNRNKTTFLKRAIAVLIEREGGLVSQGGGGWGL